MICKRVFAFEIFFSLASLNKKTRQNIYRLSNSVPSILDRASSRLYRSLGLFFFFFFSLSHPLRIFYFSEPNRSKFADVSQLGKTLRYRGIPLEEYSICGFFLAVGKLGGRGWTTTCFLGWLLELEMSVSSIARDEQSIFSSGCKQQMALELPLQIIDSSKLFP